MAAIRGRIVRMPLTTSSVDALPALSTVTSTPLLPGVDERRLRTAADEGTVAECLHGFAPRPGDCVYLPAGTVHAVGGGVLMAEVQQTSDATFRLFDWGRVDAQGKSRPLHVEESMASVHWDQGPVVPVPAILFDSPQSLLGMTPRESRLVSTQRRKDAETQR